MKDQILLSTKNIVKYINVHTHILVKILKLFSKKCLNRKDDNNAGKHILGKLVKSLIKLEFYIMNNKLDKITRLDDKLLLSYRTLKYIYEKNNLDHHEKKIIKNLLVYLFDIIKLIKKNNGHEFSEENENINFDPKVSYKEDNKSSKSSSIKINSSECHFTISENAKETESKEIVQLSSDDNSDTSNNVSISPNESINSNCSKLTKQTIETISNLSKLVSESNSSSSSQSNSSNDTNQIKSPIESDSSSQSNLSNNNKNHIKSSIESNLSNDTSQIKSSIESNSSSQSNLTNDTNKIKSFIESKSSKQKSSKLKAITSDSNSSDSSSSDSSSSDSSSSDCTSSKSMSKSENSSASCFNYTTESDYIPSTESNTKCSTIECTSSDSSTYCPTSSTNICTTTNTSTNCPSTTACATTTTYNSISSESEDTTSSESKNTTDCTTTTDCSGSIISCDSSIFISCPKSSKSSSSPSKSISSKFSSFSKSSKSSKSSEPSKSSKSSKSSSLSDESDSSSHNSESSNSCELFSSSCEDSSSSSNSSSSSSSSSSSKIESSDCKDSCSTDTSKITCSTTKSEYSKDKFNDIIFSCKNHKLVEECINKLKSLSDMHNLLKVLTSILEKQYTDQINTANGYPSIQKTIDADVDMNIKILDMYYSQFSSTINKNCGTIFNNKGCPIKIKCRFKNKKEVVLCIISNIMISINETNENKYINIHIGKEKISLKYIKCGDLYGTSSNIFKINIENMEILIKCLHNNQKILSDSICTVKEFIKYHN